uniref:Uncharacterized protein n=1 Tax=Rhizophora mucronata TaxID=61149 RepID=A0A2P2PMU7_RHIMU
MQGHKAKLKLTFCWAIHIHPPKGIAKTSIIRDM